MERKTWQVSCFGNRNISRIDLNESKWGLCRTGRGSEIMQRGRTRKDSETVVSLARGIWTLRGSKAERRRERGEVV